MFLIIEGPDNSGKSTLASYLARALCTPLRHSGGPGRDKIEFFGRVAMLLDSPGSVVFDRFPVISEHVYAPIVRGVDTFDGNNARYRTALLARNPIIVFCRPPTPILLDMKEHPVKLEHETADHVEAVKANALKLVQRYDEVIAKEYPDALYYDYTAGGPQFRSLLVRYLLAKV